MSIDFPTILGLVTVSILCIFAVSVGIFGHDILTIEEISYHGEAWLIESEYPIHTILDVNVENSLSKLSNHYNEKFRVIQIESFSDYLERHPAILQNRSPFNQTADNKFIISISGTWANHRELIQETFENIEGVKSAKLFSSSVA